MLLEERDYRKGEMVTVRAGWQEIQMGRGQEIASERENIVDNKKNHVGKKSKKGGK